MSVTGFSEHVEALGVDRQKAFRDAFRSDKPLKPRKGGWTLGDLIFLQGHLQASLENVPPFSEAEFRTPLREIFSEGAV